MYKIFAENFVLQTIILLIKAAKNSDTNTYLNVTLSSAPTRNVGVPVSSLKRKNTFIIVREKRTQLSPTIDIHVILMPFAVFPDDLSMSLQLVDVLCKYNVMYIHNAYTQQKAFPHNPLECSQYEYSICLERRRMCCSLSIFMIYKICSLLTLRTSLVM